MRFNSVVSAIIAASLNMYLAAGNSYAAPLDSFQFVKIASQESRAVIRNAEGKLLVIKTGDTIAGNVTVKEIAAGRIILEEQTPEGIETTIVRKVNGKTLIERLRKQPDRPQTLVSPVAPAVQKQ